MTSQLDAVASLMREWAGYDVNYHDMASTPARFLAAMSEMTGGYLIHPKDVLKTFPAPYVFGQMVLVKDITVRSLCRHHLLPFWGVCHVAYLPVELVAGLSKIPRLVDCLSRRLQLQEKLTHEISEALHEAVKPRGVAVMIEATHSCMCARGIKSDGKMVTSRLTGLFQSEPSVKAEFYQGVRG